MPLKRSFESSLLYKSEFFRNVLTLMTASGIGALIPFLASPIITRLYDPKDFAIFALFTTILSISAVFMGLGFDSASILAKSTKNALILIFISILCNIFLILFLIFLVFLIGKDTFFAFFDITILEPYFGLSLIAIFFNSLFVSLYFLFNREKKYKILASSKILGAFFSTASKIFFGLFALGSLGLILGQTIGIFILFTFLFYNFLKTKQKLINFSFSEIKEMSCKYKNFPLYNVPSSVISVFAANLHIILFLKFYGSQITGIIAFASTLIFVPLALISQSFSGVYCQKISITEDNQALFLMYKKALILISAISLCFILGAYLTPSSIITFIFGEKWQDLSLYLFPISIWFGFQFIGTSLYTIYMKLEKLKLLFFFNLMNIIIIYLSIYLSFIFEINVYNTLFIFGIFGGIPQLFLGIFGLYLIKNEKF